MVTISETNASVVLEPNQISNNFKNDRSMNILDNLQVDSHSSIDLYKVLDLKQNLETIDNNGSSVESEITIEDQEKFGKKKQDKVDKLSLHQ